VRQDPPPRAARLRRGQDTTQRASRQPLRDVEPPPQTMAMHRPKEFRIGRHTVVPIVDSTVIFRDPVGRYPGSTLEDWRGAGLVTPPGNPLLPPDLGAEPITVFLIRLNGRYVLVDAGAGPWDYFSIIHVPRGHLRESLRMLGVAPRDIARVILTHLHHDHVGWLMVDGKPFFSNASYCCHRADWSAFVDSADAPYYSAPLSGLADRFDFWDGCAEPEPGLTLVEAPGHTPGNSYVVVTDSDQQMILLGDVAHSPIEFALPNMISRGGATPERARATRDRLAATLPTDVPLLGSHFPGVRPGRFVDGERGRRWERI
jgi:glyoxylase-like metal-dependent hydrolase (beta-lactamase superfamily II)